MKILGITGGSGSGKTTLLRAVEHLGGLGLDCDAIYHRLLETDAALVAAIGARFPGTVRDGRVDRLALAAVVFADPAELAALDALTHEAVAREVRRRLWQSEAPFAAIDAIGLFESGLAALCDETIQLFVPGRSGQITDVWLDTAGYLTGALLTLLLFFLCRKRPKQRKNP